MERMTVNIEAINPRRFIKQWPNMPTSLIPQIGDKLVVNFGDDNEVKYEYKVVYREIDGKNTDVIFVHVDFWHDD